MDASLKKREWRIKNKELIDEKNKAYYEANKNRCRINATRYYELHRDEILQFKKEQYKETGKAIFTCECGSTCKELSRKQHLNSKKHKKFVSL